MAASSGLDTGQLLWISLKPLIKILLPSFVGAALVKAGKLGAEGVRTAAAIQIYGALPCLLFSNIVVSITTEKSYAISVCVAVASFYMVAGFALSLLLRLVLHIPANFRWGFVVAGTWSNWGNIPIPVLQTVAAEPPFGFPEAADLAVAYASFFILVNNSLMFAGPGTYMIKLDYRSQKQKPHGLNDPSSVRRSGLSRLRSIPLFKGKTHSRDVSEDSEMALLAVTSTPRDSVDGTALPNTSRLSRHASSHFPMIEGSSEPKLDTPEESDAEYGSKPSSSTSSPAVASSFASRGASPLKKKPAGKRFVKGLQRFLRKIITPTSLALVLGILVALVPHLKALFVVDDSSLPDMPLAPDGKPLLAVVLDATAYLGAAAVPLALLVLGASFARMHFPRPLSRLPWLAMFALAIMKMILLPVIGWFFIFGLRAAGLVPEEDRLLQFVLAYYASGVTATNQLALSSIAAADVGSHVEDNLDILCAFIIVQYILLPFAGTAVIAAGLELAS